MTNNEPTPGQQLHGARRYYCALCGADMGVMTEGVYQAEGRHCPACFCDNCQRAHT